MLALIVNKRSRELWRGSFDSEPYQGQVLNLHGDSLRVTSFQTILGKEESYYRVVVEVK